MLCDFAGAQCFIASGRIHFREQPSEAQLHTQAEGQVTGRSPAPAEGGTGVSSWIRFAGQKNNVSAEAAGKEAAKSSRRDSLSAYDIPQCIWT